MVAQEENCGPFTGGVNKPRVYVEASEPPVAFVHPVAPRTNELWTAGSVRVVDWHAAVPAGATATMSIDLSPNGPDGPWLSIAANVLDNGRFQWKIPTTIAPTVVAHLRYSLDGGATAQAIAGPFAILGGGVGHAPDIDGDGDVDVDAADLGALLGVWGSCPARGTCTADLDGDGVVGAAELGVLLGAWTV